LQLCGSSKARNGSSELVEWIDEPLEENLAVSFGANAQLVALRDAGGGEGSDWKSHLVLPGKPSRAPISLYFGSHK